MRTGVFREMLSIVAIIALAATSLLYMNRLQSAQALAATMEAGYKRSEVHDRLIGSPVDISALELSSTSPAGQAAGSALWILDLERCAGCFDSVADWMRLEATTKHSLYIILIGDRTRDVESRLRVLKRTSVASLPRNRVQVAFGSLLPNTKLLIDSAGIVLDVDSRSSGQECGWSFEAQVSALLGVGSSQSIRDQ